ncbi:Serine/threonine protein kinase [Streptomyces sp. 3213]|uniref:serine/threonine-protein kinase n=1 Tax=Streptomyces sp. 3213.3 TaxID=1855348 RepID=UPI00089463FF|nr:serine/threonine-protein kinase [Streptomyces sp. 3213.3]SEE31838.1 Serine/threonine protein kinase [Streptomyces sp. 3213] [Streptomyces sp. 3213.3]
MSEVGEQVRDGRLVGGRYRLLERIGSGGMGTVWRAFDELVDREVAVKQPRLPGDPEDEEFQRAAHRLYREARAAARVDHPSAVAIHDVVIEDDQLPWIVMELVRGESLHELLRRGRLAPADAARIGRAVLGALSAAHAVGIVHRDVKPANVLLGPHERVVLTDFGIAHIQGEESLTASGEFVGSLEFVAPERMSGTGAGPASDLWSLGVLLYAAVEGASPFRRTTVESTLGAILSGEPPEPTRAGPLGPLIVRMLARAPEERPGAEEVGAVLEAVAAGKDIPEPAVAVQDAEPDAELVEGAAVPEAVPEPEPEPEAESEPNPKPHTKPKSRPRRTLLITLGALLLAGLVFGTVLERFLGKDSDSWTAHQRDGMNAVVFLPPQYRLLETQAAAGTRTVTYGTGALRVRLTEWDKAADSPLAEARALGRGTANPQYTRTSFRGNKDAVLADTTYTQSGVPTRAMALIVRTADQRMYELRVDMPKGTPAEKKGTALFKGARARLTLPKK